MGFNSAFKGLMLRHVSALAVGHLQGVHMSQNLRAPCRWPTGKAETRRSTK